MANRLTQHAAKQYHFIVEDEKKIFFYDGRRIGEAYELVRKLVFEGMSSSNAHGLIDAVKEKKE